MLFLDGKHQLHNVKNGYTWQLKGGSGTMVLHSNTGRKRINILGALNPLSFDLTSIVTESNCNKELLMLFVDEIKKSYSSCEKIYIILDNAPYNRSYDLQDYCEDLGIELIYLPSYSPNLSLIERFWKFFIKKTVTNIHYDTFEKFFGSIVNFLGNLKSHVEELKKLITMNFEIIN